MVGRSVRCLSCYYVWTSNVNNPRCSKCGSRDVEDVTNISSSTLTDEVDYSKVFRAFDEGKNLIDVVKEGLCDPGTSLELWNKFQEFKMKTLEIESEQLLDGKIDEVEAELSDVKDSFEKLQYAIIYQGMWIKANCENYDTGYCFGICWNYRPTGPFVLKSMRVGGECGEWYIDPDIRFCALCPRKTVPTSDYALIYDILGTIARLRKRN